MHITKQYDQMIQDATESRLPIRYDWRLLKAQLIRESSLDPNAVSNAGATGIAQFMPDTWEEVARKAKLAHDASPYNPEHAIPAAAWYMNTLIAQWSWPRPTIDRWALALASYNAGIGNILMSQREADNAYLYADIIRPLHKVTGPRHSLETKTYVKKIFGYYSALVTGEVGFA